MIDNEQPDAPQVRNNRQNRGVPRFMSTFADLMTLLLCFFVLLVAMAEIDALKYKMVVRSMADAFGVDTPSPEDEIVKGTSVIQQTFSPAITDPVPAPDVRQDPLSDAQSLRVEDAEHYRAVRLSTLASRLEQALETGLREGQLSIETLPDRVMIRISEQASFPSASA